MRDLFRILTILQWNEGVIKMKKVTAIIVAVTLCLALSISAYATDYRATTDVNFRAGPYDTATILGVLKTGELFYSNSSNGSWRHGWPTGGTEIYQYYNGVVYGYVHSAYLKAVSEILYR